MGECDDRVLLVTNTTQLAFFPPSHAIYVLALCNSKSTEIQGFLNFCQVKFIFKRIKAQIVLGVVKRLFSSAHVTLISKSY